MYGHDSAHTGRSTANGPSTPHLAWSYSLSVPVTDNACPALGPDGTIYIPSKTSFFALQPNGTLRWKKWGTSPFDAADIRLAPAVAADGTVYIVAAAALGDPLWPSDLLYALRPADGQTRWAYNIGRATYGSPTLGPDGTIYLGSTTSPSVLDAIRPDGTRKWRWRSLSNGWIESSPALGPKGDIYLQHNSLGLVALTAMGRLKWKRGMGSGGGSLGEAFNSPAVGPDGTIYIGSSAHYFYALNPTNGSERWKVAVDSWMYHAACAISADGSTIYRGDNGGIFYAFDQAGFVKWRYNTGIPGPIDSTPALAANGIVYFTQAWSCDVDPEDKGYLYAVQATTGKLLWKYEIGFSSAAPVLAADGTLYACGDQDLAAGKAVLYAFKDF
jgi:outer membrane protein assembly factor BamB